MPTENLSPLDQFARDARGQVREPFVEEFGKSIEIGEGIERPLDLY